MKKLKIFALLILCVILAAAFIACNEEIKSPKATETDIKETDIIEINDDPNAPDIPGYSENDALDMRGKVFNIAINSEQGVLGSNILIDESSEDMDPVLEASYYRKIAVEQKYNCTIKPVYSTDVNAYLTSILGDDGAYDIAQLNCSNFTQLLTGNYLTELTDIPYLNIDKPYWNKGFYDAMAILNRHYALDGDISVQSLTCVWIFVFNKALIAKNGMESPFDLVKSGDWTYDKMHEMAKAGKEDINGDGKMTLDDDLWGLNYDGDTIQGIINSSGVRTVELDGDGIPQLTINNEIYLAKLTKIYETMRDNSYSIDTLFSQSAGNAGRGGVDVFGDGRALFTATATNHVVRDGMMDLRSTDVDFGIVPYPKWDSAATLYTPFTSSSWHPVYTIPQTNRDLENTGIILEAMAYEGMKTMRKEYYESLLKRKTARDDESSDMIDFIFGNLQYDIGFMFNIGSPSTSIGGLLGYEMSRDTRLNIVSSIDKNKGKWERAIKALIEGIEKN